MTLKVNKSEYIDGSKEFGDCYLWSSTPQEDIYHLVVASDQPNNNKSILPLREDFLMKITIACNKSITPNHCFEYPLNTITIRANVSSWYYTNDEILRGTENSDTVPFGTNLYTSMTPIMHNKTSQIWNPQQRFNQILYFYGDTFMEGKDVV